MRITPKRMITFAHFYRHQDKATNLRIIGTNHLGTRAYFRKIKQLLSPCTAVLCEYMSDDSYRELVEEHASLLQEFHEGALHDMFATALPLFFTSAQLFFHKSHVDESAAFKSEMRGQTWTYAEDAPEKHEATLQHTMLLSLLHRIPESRQREILAFVEDAVRAMKQRSYTIRDFAQSYLFLWSDKELVAMFDHILCTDRNKRYMQRIDRLLSANKHKTLGVKFGAAHLPGLRKQIEERGFVRERSLRLVALEWT